MWTGAPTIGLGAGRSGRVGPVKLPSICPRATPWVDDTVKVPDRVVYSFSIGSRGVSWMIALDKVLGGESGAKPARSSDCSLDSAGSGASNWMKRMYLR